MNPSIAIQIHDASLTFHTTSHTSVARKLNEILNQFLSWPFRVTSGSARDSEGQTTSNFGTIVYTAPTDSAQEVVEVSADALAAVIDVSETLDLGGLRDAYERVAQAKQLKKTPTLERNGVSRTTTLGIVFALSASASIEELANELDQLNRRHPDGQWPDIVIVLSKGAISYAAQFPGEGTSGDFFLSPRDVAKSITAPMYIVMVMRATGEFTLNKMCAFLLAHLALFSPGANLPQWLEVLEGTPKDGITLWGYQYKLSGDLVPVPRQFYNDRYLPPPPLRIEDQSGNVLSTVQFLPWQDGGAVLLKGKLPLEGLLIFFGKEALERGGIVRRPDAQISYVLPITEANFREMLMRLQRQSDMVVRSDQTKWVVEKFSDEGSTSPFMARLFMGSLRLRDVVFSDPAKREAFDKAYEFVIETLLNTRTTAQEINQLWHDHTSKISNGEIVHVKGQVIHIEEPIDKTLRKQVEHFLNSAVRGLKQGMPQVAKALQVEFGFLFQKASAFSNGMAKLSKADSKLATYLGETRKWSEQLLKSRNAIEHEGWMLPKVKYSQDSGIVRAKEPEILGQPVTDFVTFIMDRLCCFVEEVTAHCLQAKMPAGISITEVSLDRREPEMPERFHATLTTGGEPLWGLIYHLSKFEET